MKVIITHKNTDFDALSSLVAAHKLHPDAIPVIGYLQNKRVQEFISLHKDAFHLVSMKKIEWENVTDIIMVDFNELSRTEALDYIPDINKINWIIYDHHPEQKMDVNPIYAEVRETGSTAGILVKHLKEKDIKLTFLEATLLAIGVYSDTGNLTFPHTTSDDALAVAWLLDNNADLNIVSEYTQLSLQDEQMYLMNDIMSNTLIEEYGKTKVLFAHHTVDKYIPDLSIIAHKISDFYSSFITFISVKMKNWVYIIGRSSSSEFNILEFMQDFEPKGHKQAAFSKVKLDNPEYAITQIRERLININQNKLTAEKIMSSPVRTITKDVSIENAQKLMIRYGHNGFIVIDGDIIEGIISRRDIEKAFHHKLNDSPVKDFMSDVLVTIKPDTTFDQIEKLIIENNMGRFPVIDNGKLVGIVTRTDILKAIYNKEVKDFKNENISINDSEPKTDINIKEKMKEHFDSETYNFLKEAGKTADEMGYKAYIVGGGVRDLIIDNKKDVDIDIVIEGNAINFAEKLAKKYKGHIITHEKYGTAKLHLKNQVVDLATARTEFYEYPAANPYVDFSSIKHDLYRRDFTINALAINLNSDFFGQILDFFNGYKDIGYKRLRVLHNLSFIEDPNRIFRAVRLESKLGFTIGRLTAELAVKAMLTGKFDYFINDRIKTELKKIFSNRYNAVENIKRLSELKALNCISPTIEYSMIEIKLKKLSRYIEIIKKYTDKEIEDWVLYTNILLNEIKDEEKYNKVLNQFRFTKEQEKIVKMFRDLPFQLEKYNWADIPNSDIYYFWKKYPIETIVCAMSSLNDRNIKNSIYKYYTKLKDIKLEIDGKYLIKIGVEKGSKLGEILERLLLAKLNGEISSFKEEESLAKELTKDKFYV
ncbi:MAG: CBS domain-containing protein [Candidatus Sericytochromatia bacterium]